MKKLPLLLAFCLFSLAAAAQRFDLALSAPLDSAHDHFSVKGRNGILIKQKLSFGEYATVKVKRGAIRKWTGSSGFPGFIWQEHMEGRQSIQFKLTDGTDTSDVTMVTNVSRHDLMIGSDPNALPNRVFPILTIGTDAQKNNLSTAIYTNTQEQPWELYLDNTDAQLRREKYIGYVYRGDEYYQIIPVWDIVYKGKKRSIPFGSAGFEILDADGNAKAAVSLMDDRGIVYLGKISREERFLLANICAALLLQSVID